VSKILEEMNRLDAAAIVVHALEDTSKLILFTQNLYIYKTKMELCCGQQIAGGWNVNQPWYSMTFCIYSTSSLFNYDLHDSSFPWNY
jgi:hypothetical protein